MEEVKLEEVLVEFVEDPSEFLKGLEEDEEVKEWAEKVARAAKKPLREVLRESVLRVCETLRKGGEALTGLGWPRKVGRRS